MHKTTKPNEIERRVSKSASEKSVLPNAIEPNASSILLKKKRHMSGLMCPPTSFLAGQRNGEDRT